jgi:uncharacterized protein DUF3310
MGETMSTPYDATLIKCYRCGTAYIGGIGTAFCPHDPLKPDYIEAKTALSKQVGGDHYNKLGSWQPWEVLKRWLTTDEFRGYMKGEAIVYLARERSKGGRQDIAKALHVLQGYLELTEGEQAEENLDEKTKQKEEKHERNLHKFTGSVTDTRTSAERL